MHQFDQWYVDFIDELMNMDDFRSCWEEVKIGSYRETRYYETEMWTSQKRFVRFRSIMILHTDLLYPQLVSYIPADEASEREFTELGIPTNQNWWGYKHP